MKKAILIIILAAVAVGAVGYSVVKKRLSTDLELNSKVSAVVDKISGVGNTAISSIEGFKKAFLQKQKSFTDKLHLPSLPEAESKSVELRLKHGGVMKGKLLKKSGDEYLIEWSGTKIAVKEEQVDSVKYMTQRDVEWPYKNDVVIKKTNGVVSDGRIVSLDDKNVTVAFEEGGGEMEMGIPRTDIHYLIFAPVCNKESEDNEKHLRMLFPKMKVYKEGHVTLFTDSYVKKAEWCQKVIRAAYTEIYFKFFPLFKDRKPLSQNFVVVFDDPVEYSNSTGMPLFVLGFFDTSEKVLYLYNMFGDRMEEMLFTMLTNAMGAIDKDVDKIKKKYEWFDIFIEGQAKEFKDRYWKANNLYKRAFIDETKNVLRHELTHEIFHNWGLQSAIISKPHVDKEKLVEKRKEFIEAKTWEQKKKLFDVMMKMEKSEEIDMVAAESWLAEGLATYCATEPIGSINDELLFTYQDAVKKQQLNPIEFFTNFEKGSFVGTVSKSKFDLYAQSWAFTQFLMAKYPAQFLDYQQKIAERIAKGGKKEAPSDKDDLTLLLACLNKALPDIEKEFGEYMATYQKVDDPLVKEYIELYEIWRDLLEQRHMEKSRRQ